MINRYVILLIWLGASSLNWFSEFFLARLQYSESLIPFCSFMFDFLLMARCKAEIIHSHIHGSRRENVCCLNKTRSEATLPYWTMGNEKKNLKESKEWIFHIFTQLTIELKKQGWGENSIDYTLLYRSLCHLV